jgi:UDP-N-acetylmuramyl pentapeptide phosphotransferase/UDP-N-acetylglucosamine-1-phosphate transferase
MSNTDIGFIIGAFAISAVVQYILIKVSQRNHLLMDDHNADLPQKMHNSLTPRVGGLGIFIACFLFCIHNELGLILLGCSIPTFFAGFFEDLFGNLSPKKRLLIMIASAVLAIYFLNAVVTDFGIFTTPYWLGVVISFIAILALPNGANLIDGFNGLLAGTCLVIFTAFAIISLQLGDKELSSICLIICASLIGFLVFNYPKGLIFLGDGGAYFLGFIMAVIAMMLAQRHTDISPFFVLLAISYPVIEVIFSFARRGLQKGANPLEPDTQHFHHLVNQKLVNGNNSLTVLIILPFVIIPNIIACIFYNQQNILIASVIVFISIYLVFYKWLTNKA